MWTTRLALSKRSGMSTASRVSGLSALRRSGSAQALAGQIDAVSVVDETIEHGIGISGIANERVPLVDGELTGDDGGAAAVAVLEDLQEVVAGRSIERLEPPSRRG